MTRFYLVLLISGLIFLTACFKEDELIMPHQPGNYVSDTVEMLENYKYQVYYSLLNQQVVSSVERSSWDLGFEAADTGWRVIPNSSCFMRAAQISGKEFGSHIDTTGLDWQFNPSDGTNEALAMGKWFVVSDQDTVGMQYLVVLDRGVDENGNSRGLSQLSLDSIANGHYYFRTANIDGSNVKSGSVSKTDGYNYIHYSISLGNTNGSEPLADSWDLLFTQYTTLLYTDEGAPYPYLVTGVLLNPKNTQAAIDSLSDFESIDYVRASALDYSAVSDIIGYQWKKYNFDDGVYTVDPELIYLVRDTRGYYYKFRFRDFYRLRNSKLEKGFPSFEYRKL